MKIRGMHSEIKMICQYLALLKVPTENFTFVKLILLHHLLIYNMHYYSFPEIQNQSYWRLNEVIVKDSKSPNNYLRQTYFQSLHLDVAQDCSLQTFYSRRKWGKCLLRWGVTWLFKLLLSKPSCQLDRNSLSPSPYHTLHCKMAAWLWRTGSEIPVIPPLVVMGDNLKWVHSDLKSAVKSE